MIQHKSMYISNKLNRPCRLLLITIRVGNLPFLLSLYHPHIFARTPSALRVSSVPRQSQYQVVGRRRCSAIKQKSKHVALTVC